MIHWGVSASSMALRSFLSSDAWVSKSVWKSSLASSVSMSS